MFDGKSMQHCGSLRTFTIKQEKIQELQIIILGLGEDFSRIPKVKFAHVLDNTKKTIGVVNNWHNKNGCDEFSQVNAYNHIKIVHQPNL